MTFLLDTHAFLWFVNDDSMLSVMAKKLIEDPENVIYLSIASIWEIAIKISLGKLEMPSPFTDFIYEQLNENNFTLLEIKIEHTEIVATLPFHHRDPFDRLIIAQSLGENLPIIGRDTTFDAYGVKRYW